MGTDKFCQCLCVLSFQGSTNFSYNGKKIACKVKAPLDSLKKQNVIGLYYNVTLKREKK